ncbi:MAG: hypothetical protein EKK42_27010 [Pseudonocardiaceae bacterium]|nr:MAG: hypothetical protein EKK42_27010 [Pseudonocardiaceae bacterium]
MAPLPYNLVDSEINSVTEYFERTKNPAAAWHVLSLCHKYRKPVPKSVMAEVVRFADGIAAQTTEAIDAPTDAGVCHFRGAEIYDLWRNGTDNPIGALQAQWHDWKIFAKVQHLVDDGMSARRAMAAVAARKDVRRGVDMIKIIWNRYRPATDARRTIR